MSAPPSTAEAVLRAFLREEAIVVREDLLAELAGRVDARNVVAVLRVLDEDPSTTALEKAMVVRALADLHLPEVEAYGLALRAGQRDLDVVHTLDEALERQPDSPLRPRVLASTAGGGAAGSAAGRDVGLDAGLEPVAVEEVAFREPNFGRWAEAEEPRRYRLEVGVAALGRALAELYREHREDDLRYGPDADEPVLLRLRDAEWPAWDDLARDEPLLRDFLAGFAAYDILQAAFPPGRERRPWRVLINTVDTVRVEAGTVVVEGRAVVR